MQSRHFLFSATLFLATCLLYWSCGSSGFNVFTPEQDVQLGQQTAQEIAQNPDQYPILPRQRNQEAYNYVEKIINRLLNTGKVDYRDLFAWELTIIDDDEVLNAFVTPGGYIYVYTGLIKFLDGEDELAGVLGHEIAHAAKRHSTQNATKIYGISALLSVVTGQADQGTLTQIGLGLLNLQFGRSAETEADTYSVIYLCDTPYNSDGAAAFFQKLEDQPQPPEFLSTHPNPGDRVTNIKQQAIERNCGGNLRNEAEYARIKNAL